MLRYQTQKCDRCNQPGVCSNEDGDWLCDDCISDWFWEMEQEQALYED